MISASDFQKVLGLNCLVESPVTEWDIKTPDINRPGMQFCGFYEHFAYERPQVLGKVEMAYLEKQSASSRRKLLKKYFSFRLPCVVICRSIEPPPELLDIAAESRIWVYQSDEITSKFTVSAIEYLNKCLAPHITVHGVLIDVYGVGVLLTGKSGVGKSEAALELIKRGHQLISDDAVDICRVSDDLLIGSGPKPIRHFMEIRGIGLIDIKAMFGIGAVSLSKTIDLNIELREWDECTQYDRIGISDNFIKILDTDVPFLSMPVKPGRNLAIIIEVAARNHSLKKLGYNSALELVRNLKI